MCSLIQRLSGHSSPLYLQVFHFFTLASQLKQNTRTYIPLPIALHLSLLSSPRFLPSPPSPLHLPVTHTLPLPPSVRVICSHPSSVALCLTPIRPRVCSRSLSGRLGNTLQVMFGEIDLPLSLPASVLSCLHHHHHPHHLLLLLLIFFLLLTVSLHLSLILPCSYSLTVTAQKIEVACVLDRVTV